MEGLLRVLSACGVCSVRKKAGDIPVCGAGMHWYSQPILGSTPAGSLHLSAAVYLSGASLLKIAQVNDLQLNFLQF